ncbi:MAG: hypothetical protein Q7K44_01960 [Candidatus Liptonbacteria bacterium]|nr:hypothetical protein [Candidatus Liptonbacteria bacterium]
MKPILSKSVSWVLLITLVFIDAFLDVIRGAEGSPLWKPIADIIGIKMVPFLAPIVLIIFYFAVKILGWLVQKTDKTPKSEELILTILVIVYGFFDIWLIAVDFLGFTLITNYRLMIIPLTIIGLLYGLWAQKKLNAMRENKQRI